MSGNTVTAPVTMKLKAADLNDLKTLDLVMKANDFFCEVSPESPFSVHVDFDSFAEVQKLSDFVKQNPNCLLFDTLPLYVQAMVNIGVAVVFTNEEFCLTFIDETGPIMEPNDYFGEVK